MRSRHSLPILLIGALAFVGGSAQAQQDFPVNRVPAQPVASYPAGSFLESVAIDADGHLVIVERTGHNIIRVAPDGTQTVLAHVSDGSGGIALDLDGTMVVTSGLLEGDAEGFVTVLAEDGAKRQVIGLPGSRFLNGATLLRPGVFLVADSSTAQIFEIDIRTGESGVWLAHDSLAVNPDQPVIPGANGIRIFDGMVYVTNSAQAHVVRIPLLENGKPGAPEIWKTGIVLDDFAFAADGTLYGTTHIFNSVVRIEPDGAVTTIGTAEDGLTGSTAAAFGRTEADRNTLYVVTNGGTFLPPPTGIVPAEIVRLDVGEAGLTPLERLAHVPYPGQVAPVESWLVRCETAPGMGHLRETAGPVYLRYLEAHIDRIAFAGQLFDNPQEDPSARLYFVTTETGEEARRMMEASPYYVAGLYSGCAVTKFSGVIGNVLGGVAWPEAASRAAVE